MSNLEEFGRAFEAFKSTNDERLEALEKGDTAKAKELEQKLSRVESDLDKFDAAKQEIEKEREANAEMKRRVEQLEADRDMPGKTGVSKNQARYEELFIKWIRSQGRDLSVNQEMKELSQKDVSIGTPSAGGHAVPEVISREIEKLEYRLSDVANEVKTVQVGTSDYKELVDIGGTTAAWSSETGTRNATDEPLLRQVAPTMGELYAYMTATEWSLDDIFFDVGMWLAEAAAEQFALAVSTALWDGDGTNKPTGMTDTAPVTTPDQNSTLRAAAAYQEVANGSATAIDPDELFTLLYTLNRVYLPGASWATNRLTMSEIRKLKDSQNQYLWQPGLQAGEPNTLLGYRHWIWEDMDDVGNTNHPVAFGNFRRAYLRVVRVGTRVTLDNVTTPGFVKWYIRRREGGIPLNNDAVKFLATDT